MPKIKITDEVKQQLDFYKQFMMNREHTIGTVVGYGTYLSKFLRWTSQYKTFPLQKNIADFLNIEQVRNPKTYKECRAALYLYFKMVDGRCFSKLQSNISTPEVEAIIKQFYEYSLNVKHIKLISVTKEIYCVRNFLTHITTGDRPLCLDSITANEIRKFVVECLSHLTDSSKGRTITAIRNFFRFQKFEGMPVHESIFLLPLSPAVWRNSAFPKTMNEDVFNKLHEIPDSNTLPGKRDRCIILSFTELALRCIEVAELTIDDFNWREGYITIKNTKNHSDRKLPISAKFGQSVIEYLKVARPETTNRILFVRFKHKCGESMGCSQIRNVVRRVYLKTGVDMKSMSTGTHILRRTAGSKIYNSGNSLKMTADILGHESLDSTVRYTKVDINGLQHVISPWPEKVENTGDCNVK